MFDSIIYDFDVYKVETIGDGLHVVSGLPIRNGNEHAKAICDMAIEFQRSIRTFKVPHLTNYQIEIRIGVHTGINNLKLKTKIEIIRQRPLFFNI